MTTDLPEARKNIVEMLDNAMTAALTEVQEMSFSDPYDDGNINLLLEAIAAATAKLVERSGNKDALLKTFAFSLLDTVEK